jgi:DNA repair exonuclease SbcCD ATPase subunit
MNQDIQSNKNKLIYLVLILLLVGGIAYLAIQISKANKLNHDAMQNISLLKAEKDELNNILSSSGVINEADGQALKQNLQNLLQTYDSLQYDNEKIQDSVNNQKHKINQLLAEADKLQSQKNKDWARIYKLKKETETLRTIMKGYIHTIDSLNTANINLQNSLSKKDRELTKVNSENNDIKDKNKELQETVQLGSKLHTANISAVAIRIKGSGKQSETTRASRTNMIKVCFTIIENKIAENGNKFIYIRIISPDRKVLTLDKNSFITDNNESKIEISAKREINYQNENTDVCIYHEVLEELAKGEYQVEVYADKHKIGTSSFALR